MLWCTERLLLVWSYTLYIAPGPVTVHVMHVRSIRHLLYIACQNLYIATVRTWSFVDVLYKLVLLFCYTVYFCT